MHANTYYYIPSPPIPYPTHDHEKDNCGICQKEVKDNDKAIKCNKCQPWVHINCNKIYLKQYRHFQDNQNEFLNAKIAINAEYMIKQLQLIIMQLNVIYVLNGDTLNATHLITKTIPFFRVMKICIFTASNV